MAPTVRTTRVRGGSRGVESRRARYVAVGVAVAAVGIALSGCTSAADVTAPRPAPSQQPSTSATPDGSGQLPLKGVPTELPNPGDEMRAFQSPTGNIVCRLDESSARCRITDFSFDAPAKPADCQGSWGGDLVVDASGARFVCAAPDPTGNSPELPYDRSTIVGDVGCLSARTGVTCIDRSSGHGFLVSRERAGTF